MRIKSRPDEKRWRRARWIALAFLIPPLGLATGGGVAYEYTPLPGPIKEAVLLLYPYPYTRCGSLERSASTSLKTITSAQADFRANDRDGDGVNQFWRGDIAGLYTLRPEVGPDTYPIKLIELGLACADAYPITDITNYAVRGPKSAYWFIALLHADEVSPSPDRFAACAFPSSLAAGKWTYIIDETNVLYRKELGHCNGIAVYPADPSAEGWIPMN